MPLPLGGLSRPQLLHAPGDEPRNCFGLGVAGVDEIAGQVDPTLSVVTHLDTEAPVWAQVHVHRSKAPGYAEL